MKKNLADLAKGIEQCDYYSPRELNAKIIEYEKMVAKMDVDEAFKDETNLIALSVIRLIIGYSQLCMEIATAFDTAGWDLIFDKAKSTKHYLPCIWEIASLGKEKKV